MPDADVELLHRGWAPLNIDVRVHTLSHARHARKPSQDLANSSEPERHAAVASKDYCPRSSPQHIGICQRSVAIEHYMTACRNDSAGIGRPRIGAMQTPQHIARVMRLSSNHLSVCTREEQKLLNSCDSCVNAQESWWCGSVFEDNPAVGCIICHARLPRRSLFCSCEVSRFSPEQTIPHIASLKSKVKHMTIQSN